jgi:hypothetical protein
LVIGNAKPFRFADRRRRTRGVRRSAPALANWSPVASSGADEEPFAGMAAILPQHVSSPKKLV